MPFRFTITARCSRTRARCGCFETPHGPVHTPRFMPVGTLATVKGVSIPQLQGTGAEMVLSNTYHLHLRPGDALIARSRSMQATKWLDVLTDADVMVMIDDDIVFEPEDVWKIVEGARETRGIYGGAVGYLDWSGNMDMAIAIRTGIVKDQTLYVAAGAGVVGAEDEAEGINEEQARHRFMVHELADLPHPKGKVLQNRHA